MIILSMYFGAHCIFFFLLYMLFQVMGRVRSTSFRVRWNKPADDGGSQITEYELETDNGEGWQVIYSIW